MSRRCFAEDAHLDHLDLSMPVTVASTTVDQVPPRVGLTDDAVAYARQERESGRRCFVFGGGELVTSLLGADVMDELTVGVVPVLLGDGRRLFTSGFASIELRLTDCTVLHGKTRMVFRRR